MTDKLTAAAGLRVSSFGSERKQTIFGLFAGQLAITDVKKADTFVDQKYELSYALNANHLIYGQASSASREGGPGSSTAIQACLDELASLGYPNGIAGQDPDSLWSYELETKNTFADGRATLNAAAYYTEWKSIQTTITLKCGLQTPGNAGAADIKGVELEGSYQPIDGLTLTASGSYTHTHTRITQPNVGIGAVVGAELPMAPQFSANMSAEYGFPVTARSSGYVHGNITYQSSKYTDFALRDTAFKLPSYALMGMRTGITNDKYEVALYVTNIADKRVISYSIPDPRVDNILQPRTIGADFKVRL